MDFLFKDIKQIIENKFINNGWVTVCNLANDSQYLDGSVYSAIVSTSKIDTAIKNNSWEIRYGYGRPDIFISYKNKRKMEKYSRFRDENFEPIVYVRDSIGQIDSFLELSEEFRFYNNLYEKILSDKNKEYIYVDENGDEEIVAKINNLSAFIKLKYLNNYIYVRNKSFLIYFDFMRFEYETLEELHLSEEDKEYSSKSYFYKHLIRYIKEDKKSQSWIMGKVLIDKPKRLNLTDNKDFLDFIIGYDDYGNEKVFTCNPDKLSNYFDMKKDCPMDITPIFFSKDVLKKYYDNPTKYSVTDGYVSCKNVWSLRVDNNSNNYVAVFLKDLSTLTKKEQFYWKSFNISRQDNISLTSHKRLIEGEVFDPEIPDLYLKMKFENFSYAWYEKFSWYLFKKLEKEDEHYFESLHLLTSNNNHKEFNEQILSITKIFIDSLNEKELSRGIISKKEAPKGIDKLQDFLESRNVFISDQILFLRNVQSLRSSTVAHRRSNLRSDTRKVLSYFKIEQNNISDVLKNIFINFINLLEILEEKLLN